ncbi:MAG: fructose-1,6-bisphosphatase [Campylobacterota bacterium]|nr:fructose-1,6-bisphosphatase [Campylobacterota bacterium]
MKRNTIDNMSDEKLKYLKLLSRDYPSRGSASTRIINLQAILNLPKGTEHFLSDIHGEDESFFHVLKNGSGVIKTKIEQTFKGELTSSGMRELATLVYYPKETLERQQKNKEVDEFYEINLLRLIRLTKVITSKYTRKIIRKSLPKEFAYIIEELLYEYGQEENHYYDEIIKTIIELDRAGAFIIALAEVMQRFAIAHLHIIGDIYDRGNGAHLIMDRLESYHSLDIQWGNHDILWMGAASGCLALIASAIRISLRYGSIATLEEGYGISLRPLSIFAYEHYGDDPCPKFMPRSGPANHTFTEKERNEIAKMQKSIAMMQFKLEAQLISKNPQWGMEDRTILEKVNLEKGVVEIDGIEYKLNDTNLNTLSESEPFKLNDDEREVMRQLKNSFVKSEKLRRHTRMLYNRGAVYACYNNNLLYHGCIPMDEEGEFLPIKLNENSYSGKKLLERCDYYARRGFFSEEIEKREKGQQIMWFLWAGKNSPLFGKEKMTTFENYFIDDKSSSVEPKNHYYEFRDHEESCVKILSEFGLSGNAKIINGHVPVKVKRGESPIKSGGKLIVIDGGFSRAYQGVTGIAGYTLVDNSQGMSLVSHEPFNSTDDAIENGADIAVSTEIIEKHKDRILVKQTDIGKKLAIEIEDLKELLFMYREGIIKEK